MFYGMLTPNFGEFGEARALADLASEAEQAGWDGFFLWDHIQFPDLEPTADPWVALGAIAMRTDRIRLGTLVTPIGRRRVAKLAREVLTLDRLSGGRAILGVGLGYKGIPEYADFGDETDPRLRGEMLDEGLELLSKLMSGKPVKHHGTHYQAETTGFGSSVQKPRVPIWVAGEWPGTKPFRRAARWDGVVPMSKRLMEGHMMEPKELSDLMDYVADHRTESGSFEVAHLGASDGPPVREFADAGATWWMACAAPGDTIEQVRDRLRSGPPPQP